MDEWSIFTEEKRSAAASHRMETAVCLRNWFKQSLNNSKREMSVAYFPVFFVQRLPATSVYHFSFSFKEIIVNTFAKFCNDLSNQYR